MSDATGTTVLSTAAPRFSDEAITRIVERSYGVNGSVLRRLNSERDQVVMFGDDARQLVVKLSNESESASNIDLEEQAAVWAVTTDPGLPLTTPLPLVGSDVRHGVVEHPVPGAGRRRAGSATTP